jgi:hypothetical protein
MGGYAILGGRELGDMAGWRGWDLLLVSRYDEGRGMDGNGLGRGCNFCHLRTGGDVTSAIVWR